MDVGIISNLSNLMCRYNRHIRKSCIMPLFNISSPACSYVPTGIIPYSYIFGMPACARAWVSVHFANCDVIAWCGLYRCVFPLSSDTFHCRCQKDLQVLYYSLIFCYSFQNKPCGNLSRTCM
jgi:hypothetical protein